MIYNVQVGQSERYQVTQQYAPSILPRVTIDCENRSG